ncbi:MAG: phosphoribosylformylglycinamidine synthase II [Candidatus Solincola sediminis]|uniref:Phosphoribosylformylglycinamidine synthase subunit PurL n=1 Tax=Candidatus Solincola sediminis TaxID=1797199 RepID=A0A1F2WK89_9ACTN|nr:MAG: phosphoribosylformylglycinamidine synthase II [Candidatus Solincola sediminis]
MAELYEELGLTSEEYQEIIRVLGREPNKVELGMYSLMWSEHCSYKSSRASLGRLPSRASYVLQGPGENAGIIDIGGGLAVAFKMESHNHPSAVEPYQGAATGIGGIVRDIFTMGARPIACLDPLRFGDPKNPRTRYLLSGVVSGIAGYGNCLGIPTVAGDIYFDECYDGNPLVNVMCIGLMAKENLTRGQATGVGNAVVLMGNRTGRDGIGGASVLASQEFDETSQAKRPSVQVGDPFTEKLLIEACLELLDKGLLVGLQDLGAAGIICACSETAARGGVGMRIDLDKVPLREDMEPFEIVISESQERMLAIVEPEHLDEVLAICAKWGLNGVVVGEVTPGDELEFYWRGEKAADIPASTLASGPIYDRAAERPAYLDEANAIDMEALDHPGDYGRVLLDLISGPNLCDKRWVYEQYDHMVQLNTIVYPGSDAAVLRVKGTSKALSVSCDGNSRYVYLDPYRGTQIALAEAARNVVASGGVPMALTNCLNFGNPERADIFWQFKEAVRGLADAAQFLELPVVSGNVSFYNESSGEAIRPTPVIGMVGLIGNLAHRRTIAFPSEGLLVLMLGTTEEELGGSEYLKLCHGMVAGEPPKLDLQLEKKVQATCIEGIRRGIILSAHDCSEGGAAVALLECCCAGGIGAVLEVEESIPPIYWLFSESQSRFIITISESDLKSIQDLAAVRKVPVRVLGKTGGDRLKINDWLDLGVDEMSGAKDEALEKILSAEA